MAQLSDFERFATIIIVVLAVLSAFGFAWGNILQKQGLDRLPQRRALWREVLVSPLWWAGLLVTAFAVILSYGATAMGSLSLIQPIVSLNPLLSVWLAQKSLGERLDPSLKWALWIFAAGVLSLALHTDEQAVWVDAWPYGLAAGGLSILVVFSLLLPAREGIRWAVSAGLGFALSPLLFKGLWQEWAQSGSGNDPLLLMACPSLIPFVIVYVYSFIVSQLALANGKVSTVVPISAGLGMLGSTGAGILLFGESMSLTKLLGLLILVLSLGLFARVASFRL